MIVQGTNGYDFDYTTEVHECGPSGCCVIEDALSKARCHYHNGSNIQWILNNYEAGLREMVNMKYWRSADALFFLLLLQRLTVSQGLIAAPHVGSASLLRNNVMKLIRRVVER